jgi:hypothetical protein
MSETTISEHHQKFSISERFSFLVKKEKVRGRGFEPLKALS